MAAHLHIEALQTVVPSKPTSPKTSTKLLLNIQPSSHDLVSSVPFSKSAVHIIFFFTKSTAVASDSGRLHAALIKESLSQALAEQPALAGRLRTRPESEDGIVWNDSGVRLVEAKLDAEMKEVAGGGEGLEELVYWEDFTHQNAHFTPLFYLQVTNFSCGGYSIGFSGSLLLVDPFSATSFLKTWIKLHQNLVLKNKESKLPMFYHPHLTGSKTTSFPIPDSKARKPTSQFVIFTIPSSSTSNLDHKKLANYCIEKAGGWKIRDRFWVLIKGSPKDDGEIVLISRSEDVLEKIGDELKLATTWDELGLGDFWVNQGERSYYAACWISCISGEEEEGFVVISPGLDETKLVVGFP